MKKKLRATWYTFVIVSVSLLALCIIAKYPWILVGLFVLAFAAMVFDKVYRTIE